MRGVQYTVSTGSYDDGRIGKIFLAGPKAGTYVGINAKDAAVVVCGYQGFPPLEPLAAEKN